MTLTDDNLREMLAALSHDERRAVEQFIKTGEGGRESFHALRRLRRKLKRKVRARLPRKLVWLG